jgi:hypothetical protein
MKIGKNRGKICILKNQKEGSINASLCGCLIKDIKTGTLDDVTCPECKRKGGGRKNE